MLGLILELPQIEAGEVNYENISHAEEHITSEGVKNSAATIAPKGTLLMAMYGQGVTRGRVAILRIDASYNQACAGIFVDSRVRVDFLRLFFYRCVSVHKRWRQRNQPNELEFWIYRKDQNYGTTHK